MTSSEILDTALKAYQRLGGKFLRLTVAPTIFCLAGAAFVGDYVLPQLFLTRDPHSLGVQFDDLLLTLALGLFVGGPLFLMGLSYTSALAVRLVAQLMMGEPIDEAAAVQDARRAAPRLFWVNLRVMLISVSGILAAIALLMLSAWIAQATSKDTVVAGVVALIGILGLGLGFLVFLGVAAQFSVAPAVAVLEDANAKTAARRSRQLLKGTKYHPGGASTVWSLYMLLGVSSLVFSGGIAICYGLLDVRTHLQDVLSGLPMANVILACLDLVPGFLVIWTLLPAWATGTTVLYYERRIRLEGYDIDALAAQIPPAGRSRRFEL